MNCQDEWSSCRIETNLNRFAVCNAAHGVNRGSLDQMNPVDLSQIFQRRFVVGRIINNDNFVIDVVRMFANTSQTKFDEFRSLKMWDDDRDGRQHIRQIHCLLGIELTFDSCEGVAIIRLMIVDQEFDSDLIPMACPRRACGSIRYRARLREPKIRPAPFSKPNHDQSAASLTILSGVPNGPRR